MAKKAIPSIGIIGSGIAGLASAVRLSALGLDVTVYEQQATYGGKMGEVLLGEYRFDTGPSLFTMPHYVKEVLALTEDNQEDFGYSKLDVLSHYFWDDGTKMKAYADQNSLAQEFEDKLGEPRKAVHQFLRRARTKFEITNHVFLEKSLHRLSTYLNSGTFFSFLKLSKVEIFKNMNAQNKKLFKTAKATQFFNRYATYNGSNPYAAPATLNVIPHYEYGFGAFFPNNGIRSIATSLYHKAIRQGVEFNFNYSVSEVEKFKEGYRINKAVSKDVLVCNMDIVTASRGPLKDLIPKKNKNYEPSSSALIFYWGIKKKFKALDVHNIFFSNDYKKEFKTIFNDKSIGDDITVYIHISSKIKKDDAPKYGENWFVMVNAPHIDKQDWEVLIHKTRSLILKKVSKILGSDIAELIEEEEILTPQKIYSNTGSFKGALYGSSSNKRLSAFLRQPNFSSKHKGLYFCGGSSHPGGGIPLCLLSSKIMVEKLKEDYDLY